MNNYFRRRSLRVGTLGIDHGMDAIEVLLNMGLRYATCKTYSDVGMVRNLDRSSRKVTFQTHFLRPGKFRFEWRERGCKDEPDQYTIWSDGITAYSRMPFHNYGVRRLESLQRAVAAATGVSCGAAHTIFAMLQESGGYSFDSLTKIVQGPNRYAHGESCFHLDGHGRRSRRIELWISRNDFSLRKIRDHVVITVSFQKKIMDDLKKRNPDLYKEAMENLPPFKERRYVQETVYTDICFDGKIDLRTFKPKF